jgi:hypothetical protein
VPHGGIFQIATVLIPLAIIGSFVGDGLAYGRPS